MKHLDGWDILAGAGVVCLGLGAWLTWPPLLLVLGLAIMTIAIVGANRDGPAQDSAGTRGRDPAKGDAGQPQQPDV